MGDSEPQQPEAALLEGIEAHSWTDLYKDVGFNVTEIDDVTVLSAPEFPNPDLNRAVGLGAVGPADEDLLDQVIETLDQEIVGDSGDAQDSGGDAEGSAPKRVPFYLQVVPESDPPELHQWIAERGFTKRRRWVKLWRSLANVPEPDAEGEVMIRLVTPRKARVWAETICKGFGLPVEVAVPLQKLVGKPHWRPYLAYIGDSVAGAALMHIGGKRKQPKATAMVLGCTLPAFRGKGVQGAMLERRLFDAYQERAKIAVSEAAEDIPDKPNPSLHNLLRLGFKEAYKRENYQRA